MKLVFRRVSTQAAKEAETSPVAPDSALGKNRKRHPLFGILKGKVTIVPGTDLTKPADPSWGLKYRYANGVEVVKEHNNGVLL